MALRKVAKPKFLFQSLAEGFLEYLEANAKRISADHVNKTFPLTWNEFLRETQAMDEVPFVRPSGLELQPDQTFDEEGLRASCRTTDALEGRSASLNGEGGVRRTGSILGGSVPLYEPISSAQI